ncbi:PKD domain-containing protein [Halomicrobium zhouii]|uniref:PKD domain-containing protein n=1 Tax=Halomicrobium zhouii TaxID=767519 RepID=UPI001160C2A1|nr:PKD domain-containing protein [Halomicrobium zhouii]
MTVTFEQTGTYSAGLFAKFSDGEVEDVAKEGTIEGSGDDSGGETGDPVANIEYSPQDPVANPISFDGSGSSTPEGEIESYEWYHKQGEPDSDGMFEYVLESETYEDSFESGTTWSVKLEVTNSAGNTATETVTFTPVETEPVANIEYSPQDPVYNPITFDASGSSVAGGEIVSYDWYLKEDEEYTDNTTPLFEQNRPSATGETYEESFSNNPWTVGLEVTDANGNTDRDSVTVSPIDATPNAVANVYPEEISPPNPITLDASESTTPVGSIESYEWEIRKYNYDDEKVDTLHRTGEVVEENWDTPYVYTFDLIVTNDVGEHDQYYDSFKPEA